MPLEVFTFTGQDLFARVWSVFLLALLAAGGCSKEPAGHPTSSASNEAVYGSQTALPSSSIPRVRPMPGKAEDWSNASFACVKTELSPATLYHSSTRYIAFFTHLADDGLSPPA